MNLIICDYRVLAYSARDATMRPVKVYSWSFSCSTYVVFRENCFISKINNLYCQQTFTWNIYGWDLRVLGGRLAATL